MRARSRCSHTIYLVIHSFMYLYSAGAGGCPLAQTMAENGLSVLLLERGGEQVYNSQQVMTSIKAITDECAESIRSTPGHTLTTGNCMGGTFSSSSKNSCATSYYIRCAALSA